MKKLLLAIFAFIFVACSDSNSEKVYKFGISPDYPPFDSVVDGKITGFDAELLENLAKIAGFKYEFIAMSFDGLIAGLKAGKIDAIISAMSASEQRKKACDFSNVYYKARTIYIKHKDSPYEHKDELKDKKVGVQLGTVQEAAVKELGAVVSPNETPTVLVLALNEKKLEALALDALVAREFLAKNEDLVEFFSEEDGTEGFSIAFDKGKNADLKDKLNKALEEFSKTPEYEELLKKYNII